MRDYPFTHSTNILIDHYVTGMGLGTRETIINKIHIIPQGTQRDRCQETILLFIILIQKITEYQFIDTSLIIAIIMRILYIFIALLSK